MRFGAVIQKSPKKHGFSNVGNTLTKEFGLKSTYGIILSQNHFKKKTFKKLPKNNNKNCQISAKFARKQEGKCHLVNNLRMDGSHCTFHSKFMRTEEKSGGKLWKIAGIAENCGNCGKIAHIKSPPRCPPAFQVEISQGEGAGAKRGPTNVSHKKSVPNDKDGR